MEEIENVSNESISKNLNKMISNTNNNKDLLDIQKDMLKMFVMMQHMITELCDYKKSVNKLETKLKHNKSYATKKDITKLNEELDLKMENLKQELQNETSKLIADNKIVYNNSTNTTNNNSAVSNAHVVSVPSLTTRRN